VCLALFQYLSKSTHYYLIIIIIIIIVMSSVIQSLCVWYHLLALRSAHEIHYENHTTCCSHVAPNIITYWQSVLSPLPPIARHSIVGQGLLIVEASRAHPETLHSVGLLRTDDQLNAGTSTWRHATLVRDRKPFTLRDSNPQSHQANSRKPAPRTVRPLESAQ
jgi:hypothetical protein